MPVTRPPITLLPCLPATCLGLVVAGLIAGCDQHPPAVPALPPVGVTAESAPGEEALVEADFVPRPAVSTQSLFNATDLTGWKVCQFGGDGDVAVVDGALELGIGRPLTGVTWNGEPLPVSGYRLSLDARRVHGIDFFCCLTFPVGESHCSLVVGGWAGTVVGLSCVDGADASDNATTHVQAFRNGQWYRIEVEVTESRIAAWIDGVQVVQQRRAGHQFTVRNEVRRNRPLGLSTFECTGQIRNLELYRLEENEKP